MIFEPSGQGFTPKKYDFNPKKTSLLEKQGFERAGAF
jgi:hypothetical protein